MKHSSFEITILLLSLILLSGCSIQSAQSVEQSPQVIAANELAAMSRLRSIDSAEASFMVESGGTYASLDELVNKGIIGDPARGKLTGYRFEVRVKPGGYEATAVPVQYGISGKRSFYIDESHVLRGGERRGAKATSLDPVV